MRGVKRGFTLVELSLSIAFIAILSITITLIINDAISTYRRGVTLNQLNTVGMDLVDDMRSAVGGSVAVSLVDLCDIYEGTVRDNCITNGGEGFMVAKGPEREIEIDDADVRIHPYGVFCTGKYSYIWNSGYVDAGKITTEYSSYKATLDVIDGSGRGHYENFRLLKVDDEYRAVCADVDNLASGHFVSYESGTPEILLEGGSNANNRLALYDLSAMLPVTNDNNTASLYSVSFILGTVDGGINVMSNGNFCQTPEGGSSDENFDYCAINKFNFAIRATSQGGGD